MLQPPTIQDNDDAISRLNLLILRIFKNVLPYKETTRIWEGKKRWKKKNFIVLALQYRMRTYECRTFFAYKEIINKNVSTLQTNG